MPLCTLGDLDDLPVWQLRNVWLPEATFPVDACIRLGCAARSRCDCVARGLRPRVKWRWLFFEYFIEFPIGSGQASWRAARDRASRPKMSATKRARIIARDGGRCVQCQSRRNLEIDHIVPVAHSGGEADGNLQTLCRHCNREKWHRLEAASA